jgi:hypothetical protein
MFISPSPPEERSRVSNLAAIYQTYQALNRTDTATSLRRRHFRLVISVAADKDLWNMFASHATGVGHHADELKVASLRLSGSGYLYGTVTSLFDQFSGGSIPLLSVRSYQGPQENLSALLALFPYEPFFVIADSRKRHTDPRHKKLNDSISQFADLEQLFAT